MTRTRLLGALAGLCWISAIIVHLANGASETATRYIMALIALGVTLTILCSRASPPISVEVAYKLGFQHGRNFGRTEVPPEE